MSAINVFTGALFLVIVTPGATMPWPRCRPILMAFVLVGSVGRLILILFGLSRVVDFDPKKMAVNVRTPSYEIIDNRPNSALIIRDIGNHGFQPTITNAVEDVVRELHRRDMLPNHRPLFYYDSDGLLSEIVHRDGAFVRFA